MLNFESNVKNKTGIWLFMLWGLFFTFGSTNPTQADEHTNESKIENPYFLDFGALRPLRGRRYFQESMYMDKKDPGVAWIAFPIIRRPSDYYSAVAGVVAAELHRRIDKNAVVPITKFVITKLEDGHNHELMGYVYQEIPFAKPVRQARKQNGFNDYANHTIYKDHNIERSVATWKCLGLSTSPSSLCLAVSEDNKLVRYDYDEAFHYNNLDIDEECFYTSDFLVNSYRCDTEYIKSLKHEQNEQYHVTLKAVVDDIRAAASQYLTENEQGLLNRALERIMMKFQC